MIRSPDGELVILDFGLITEITEDQKFGMVEAIAHLIHRDYDKIGDDFVTLGFIPPGTDLKPIIPALSRVFDAALEGGGAKSINFNDLAADLAEITFEYPFRIPSFFALIIRAIGVLEGIALNADKDFAIVDASYPFISKKLLTDSSPRMQKALRYMVYGKSKRFDVDRVIDILNAFENFATVKQVAQQGMSAVPSGSSSPPAVGTPERSREALQFFFGNDGKIFREFLLDEIVASLDALFRTAYRPSGISRVDDVLRKLAPPLDSDDDKSLANAKELYDFLLASRRGDRLPLPPAQLRQLTPLIIEHSRQLRLFAAQVFARLAEKQIGRTLGALVDTVAPPPPPFLPPPSSR